VNPLQEIEPCQWVHLEAPFSNAKYALFFVTQATEVRTPSVPLLACAKYQTARMMLRHFPASGLSRPHKCDSRITEVLQALQNWIANSRARLSVGDQISQTQSIPSICAQSHKVLRLSKGNDRMRFCPDALHPPQ
jgi:hypothetical protein